jgi:hypothetical protein
MPSRLCTSCFAFGRCRVVAIECVPCEKRFRGCPVSSAWEEDVGLQRYVSRVSEKYITRVAGEGSLVVLCVCY